MGLDQVWARKKDEDEYESLHYHRKFNALEGFMAAQWAEETGRPAEKFNCEYFTVTLEILDKLERTNLEPTPGFFFGNNEKDEWYYKDMQELRGTVIPDIRERLKKGETIAYSSWW